MAELKEAAAKFSKLLSTKRKSLRADQPYHCDVFHNIQKRVSIVALAQYMRLVTVMALRTNSSFELSHVRAGSRSISHVLDRVSSIFSD